MVIKGHGLSIARTAMTKLIQAGIESMIWGEDINLSKWTKLSINIPGSEKQCYFLFRIVCMLNQNHIIILFSTSRSSSVWVWSTVNTGDNLLKSGNWFRNWDKGYISGNTCSQSRHLTWIFKFTVDSFTNIGSKSDGLVFQDDNTVNRTANEEYLHQIIKAT